MAIPDFVKDLRTHIGHAPLWLSGVSAVIVDGDPDTLAADPAGLRVLLTRRADSGQWAVVSGILEPGEEPPAVCREATEETGIDVEILRLSSVDVTHPITYPNGDVAQYLDITFLARHRGGTPRVADEENLDVGWFAVTDLPDNLADTSRLRIAKALSGDRAAWFRRE